MPRSTVDPAWAQGVRVLVGQAVNRAIKESKYGTQIPFADALEVDQTTVSKWITGKTAMTVEQVRLVEALCDLPRGQILVWAGLVDLETVAPPGAITVDGADAAAVLRSLVALPMAARKPARKQPEAPKRGPKVNKPSPPTPRS